ncbi:UNVERIFIED_CONTAM: hypothetical protein NCL1_05362 [Trichonephila clavipes]
MSKRRKCLTELEITEMMENISDMDSETDFEGSERDTIIYSDCSDLEEFKDDISDINMPSTPKANISTWSTTIENLAQLPFKEITGLKVDSTIEEEIDFSLLIFF